MAPPGNLPKILHDIRAEWVTQPMPVSWPSVPVGVYWPDTPVTCRDLMRFDNGVMGYFAESHRDPSIKSPAERLMCATDDKAINSANYGFADPRRVLEGLDTEFDKHASGDHDKRSILNAYILLTRLLPDIRELARDHGDDPFLRASELATADAVVHALKVIYKLGKAVGVVGLFAVPYEG